MTFIDRKAEIKKNNIPKETTKKPRKLFWGIASAVLCTALVVGGFVLYNHHQIRKIPNLTFTEALADTTKDHPNATITVGILKDGESSYHVYGENGKELPKELHTYEIGSLTKTLTAALINKAVREEKISLDHTIDSYLSLPSGNHYPTIAELLTHTSGYKGYYFEAPMISNFLCGRNDFYGITKEMVLEKTGSFSLKEERCDFNYSNFGYAVLGLVLEEVYDTNYTVLLNDFAKNDLKLQDTKVSEQNGDLGNYWCWQETDAYKPAGAVTSNISDLLLYAQMQLEDHPSVSGCHNSLKQINAATPDFLEMGIRMDEIGMSWLIDNQNGILWHNGGTDNYNCYLGFDMEHQTAVVVLSNLAPSERFPATVLGVKLFTELNNADETLLFS